MTAVVTPRIESGAAPQTGGSVSALWTELIARSKEACFIEFVIAGILAADYTTGINLPATHTWALIVGLLGTRFLYTVRRIIYRAIEARYDSENAARAHEISG